MVGEYTLRDTYEHMWNTNAPFESHSLVWYAHKNPRHFFISWMTLLGGLKTLEKMKQCGVIESDKCVLCWRDTATENPLHKCRYLRKVWTMLLKKMIFQRHIAERTQVGFASHERKRC